MNVIAAPKMPFETRICRGNESDRHRPSIGQAVAPRPEVAVRGGGPGRGRKLKQLGRECFWETRGRTTGVVGARPPPHRCPRSLPPVCRIMSRSLCYPVGRGIVYRPGQPGGAGGAAARLLVAVRRGAAPPTRPGASRAPRSPSSWWWGWGRAGPGRGRGAYFLPHFWNRPMRWQRQLAPHRLQRQLEL